MRPATRDPDLGGETLEHRASAAGDFRLVDAEKPGDLRVGNAVAQREVEKRAALGVEATEGSAQGGVLARYAHRFMRSFGYAARMSALVALCAAMVSPSPAQAAGQATVRLMHAVPGGGAAELAVASEGKRTPAGSPVRFGRTSEAKAVPSGSTKLLVVPPGERDPVASASQRLEPGARYTAVAMLGEDGPTLRVLRDGDAAPGVARVRTVHAAPELGEPDVRLDGRLVAKAARYEEVTDYLSLTPGSYDLSARRPSGKGDALLSQPRLPLVAGTAATVYVVGSRGEPTRAVLVADDTIAPNAPPDTGLGGLSRGAEPRLLAILLAGLSGGLLALAARRRIGTGSRR